MAVTLTAMGVDSNAVRLTRPVPFVSSVWRKVTKVTTNAWLKIQLKRMERLLMWLNLLSVSYPFISF